MILKIGEINVAPYALVYDAQLIPQYGANGFVAENGDIITDLKGDKVSVKMSLKRVPDNTARQISAVVNTPSFAATISVPFEITETFTKTSYKAVPYEKGLRWDIDFTFESAALVNIGNCL